MAITYEVIDNKIKETKVFDRADTKVTEVRIFRLSEAEASLATAIAAIEAQIDMLNLQLVDYYKQRDDFTALRTPAVVK